MKTTNRRFITALFAFVLTIAIAALPNVSRGQGMMSSSATLGPINPTQSFLNDVSYALLNGLPAYGSYQSIPNGSAVVITNIFYSGGSGGALYHTLAITSSVPFTLAQITGTQTSPFSSFSGTFGSEGISYSLFGIGISNNIVYSSGNANTPVLAAYVIGYSYAININSLTTDQALAGWSSVTPFTEGATYAWNGLTASSYVSFVASATSVPEPPTYALIALGIASIIVVFRRRK